MAREKDSNSANAIVIFVVVLAWIAFASIISVFTRTHTKAVYKDRHGEANQTTQ